MTTRKFFERAAPFLVGPLSAATLRLLYPNDRPVIESNTKVEIQSSKEGKSITVESNMTGTMKPNDGPSSVIEIQDSSPTYFSECLDLLGDPVFLGLLVLAMGTGIGLFFFLYLRFDLDKFSRQHFGSFYFLALFLILQCSVFLSSLVVGGLYRILYCFIT